MADIVEELDLAMTDPFGWHTAILQRARIEIVALRRTIMFGPDLPALARDEALEEAARLCEGGYTCGSTRATLEAIAAAIRALKEKP